MARLSPARKAALALVGRARRQAGRIRDMARDDAALRGLSEVDRALAFRLALGATSAQQQLDALIDQRLRRPSSLEPRVRDALRLAAFELCYLSTPASAAVSQGVEMVRSVAPRATGLANAVLRRVAEEDRPRMEAARERVAAGGSDLADLALVSGISPWLMGRIAEDRGEDVARGCALAQGEPAVRCVAANMVLRTPDEVACLLAAEGLDPRPLAGIAGAFVLGEALTDRVQVLVRRGELVVADPSAQAVCRIAGAEEPARVLEVGQGRGTKSILMCAAAGVVRPLSLAGVDSVAYKVRVSRDRMRTAGLSDLVKCVEFDACKLGKDDLPDDLAGTFDLVLVDAPCSGTGTMRRHPEIASELTSSDVDSLAQLQGEMLAASAARVAPGGTLVYATCSVLRQEDEEVIEAFLASEAGRDFESLPVAEAPACRADASLAREVSAAQTPEGFFLSTPAVGRGDGHFCARLVRRAEA